MSGTDERLALKALILIISKEETEDVEKLFKDMHIHLLYRFNAHGTASSEILDMLGLTEAEKTLFICIAPSFAVRTLIAMLVEDIQLRKPGRGLGFVIPLSGMANPHVGDLDPDIYEKIAKHIEREVNNLKGTSTHSLIVAVINRGFSDELMEAVKPVGARGGTVIHARKIGNEESLKLWGISVQAEKEIVAILAERRFKLDIMRAASQKCGMQSKARGVVFSLPVEEVEGLNDNGGSEE